MLGLNCLALAEEVYGFKTKEDIAFVDMEWAQNREAVYDYLKERYGDAELVEEVDFEYDYTDRIIVRSYKYYDNKNPDYLCSVGDVSVDYIIISYLIEDGKFDEVMDYGQYHSKEYDKFVELAEMLQYKYGDPYSKDHNETNTSFYRNISDKVLWKNEDETRSITLRRYDKWGVSDGGEEGLELTYSDHEFSDYLSTQFADYLEREEQREAQEKEDELRNKNYDGL